MSSSVASTSLSLPAIFSDGMILQRDLASDWWGWATPGSTIRIELAGHTLTTQADAAGRWRTQSPILPAGGPYEYVVSSGNQKIVVKDVLIGEVWLCSGQSNMEWPLRAAAEGEKEVAHSTDPLLRQFGVPKVIKGEPQERVEGAWHASSPEHAGMFTAVGYFMARELRKRLNVPVGIINSTWGGTVAEAWTPRTTLNADPLLRPMLKQIPADPEAVLAQYKPYVDPGNKGFDWGWAANDLDDSDWKQMDLPRLWETTGLDIDGAVWFRLHVNIPQAWITAGQDLLLSLSILDDFDETYFNGTRVGGMGLETTDVWITPRNYTIPHQLLKQGDNVIAVRIFDQWGGGGFAGQAGQLYLQGPGEARIPLAGDWKFNIELELPPAPMGASIWPTSLYNAMIHPLAGFGIAGVAWYQGESNADRAFEYRDLIAAMINAWRQAWGRSFPFIQVQVANYEVGPSAFPQGAHWAELREAQAVSATKLFQSAFVTAADIGDTYNVHPANKQEVGRRLAHASLAIAYGQNIPYLGPTFESVAFEGPKAIVSFTHAEEMTARGEITNFTIAGNDRVFHTATATIQGSTVEVQSDQVTEPASVRYGWWADPVCNLYNRDNLPMPPFRTDDWLYLTQRIK